jgi:SsrA-binding protein
MAKEKAKPGDTLIADNRRARHDYEILETLECGIALQGSEVKSLRDHKVSLQEGYVVAKSNPPRLLLHSVNIAEYGPAGPATSHAQHALTRTRVLLAKRREILKLAEKMESKGMTIVPLKMYFSDRGWVKVLIGLGRGRAKHDKRDAIAKREMKREMDRATTRRM